MVILPNMRSMALRRLAFGGMFGIDPLPSTFWRMALLSWPLSRASGFVQSFYVTRDLGQRFVLAAPYRMWKKFASATIEAGRA
jgi:hypothetical protein